MRRRRAAALVALFSAADAYAHPPGRSPARAGPPAHVVDAHPVSAQPLPMLPGVARVEVQAARDHVVLVEDVALPRGEWRAGGLDLYVAYGAPGVPVALDAKLVGVLPEGAEARSESGEPVAVEQAVRRSPTAQMLLGKPQMAGVVLHVKEAELRRVYASTEVATLRIRSLLPAPVADPHGARDLVVRLGIAGDLPLTLGHVQVVALESQPPILRAQAVLCGPDAETRPLSVSLGKRAGDAAEARTAGDPPSAVDTIAPQMAVRHASDDLCIRWWTAP